MINVTSEILREIVPYIPNQDLLAFKQTCKNFRRVLNSVHNGKLLNQRITLEAGKKLFVQGPHFIVHSFDKKVVYFAKGIYHFEDGTTNESNRQKPPFFLMPGITFESITRYNKDFFVFYKNNAKVFEWPIPDDLSNFKLECNGTHFAHQTKSKVILIYTLAQEFIQLFSGELQDFKGDYLLAYDKGELICWKFKKNKFKEHYRLPEGKDRINISGNSYYPQGPVRINVSANLLIVNNRMYKLNNGEYLAALNPTIPVDDFSICNNSDTHVTVIFKNSTQTEYFTSRRP